MFESFVVDDEFGICSLTSLDVSERSRFGRRPNRDAARLIPTSKHFFNRQYGQELRLNGVISQLMGLLQ
jgi:hypothetical protein